MKKEQAVILLTTCKDLASKLTRQGIDKTELTEADCKILAGFNRVWVTSWLQKPGIQRQAGLDLIEINILRLMGSKMRIERMRKQHETKEHLDYEESRIE